jgi:hypothetical protein
MQASRASRRWRSSSQRHGSRRRAQVWLGSSNAGGGHGEVGAPLALVFNDHQSLRTDLRIALSWDGGYTWKRVATVEQ